MNASLASKLARTAWIHHDGKANNTLKKHAALKDRVVILGTFYGSYKMTMKNKKKISESQRRSTIEHTSLALPAWHMMISVVKPHEMAPGAGGEWENDRSF